MAKKMSSLVRKILSEVGRNEMLSWGLGICQKLMQMINITRLIRI